MCRVNVDGAILEILFFALAKYKWDLVFYWARNQHVNYDASEGEIYCVIMKNEINYKRWGLPK